MNQRCHTIVLIYIVAISACLADDRWAWSSHNRHDRALSDRLDKDLSYQDKYRGALYGRDRDREPTTRRPSINGVSDPQIDDIDDYPDPDDSKINRDYPYPYPLGGFPGGYQPGGFNQFAPGGGFINRQHGHPANGILVGPGGPTGIIGRPTQHFPGAGTSAGAGGGGGGYPPIGFGGGYQNQNGFQSSGGNGGGYPIQVGGVLPGSHQVPGVFPAGGQVFGFGQNHLSSHGQQGFPGQVGFPALGRFPPTGGFQIQPGGYDGTGSAGLGSQYPLGAGHYHPGPLPHYTGGYGLAYPGAPGFSPFNTIGRANNGYATAFDDSDDNKNGTNRKLNSEGRTTETPRSSNSNLADKTIDVKEHRSQNRT